MTTMMRGAAGRRSRSRAVEGLWMPQDRRLFRKRDFSDRASSDVPPERDCDKSGRGEEKVIYSKRPMQGNIRILANDTRAVNPLSLGLSCDTHLRGDADVPPI